MYLLFGFAFLSGLATILAPCIWPLLPIVLSTSVAGESQGYKRPLGVTLGIMVSFAFFTLTLSSLVKLFHFDPNNLRIFAVIVLVFFGLTMIVPALTNLVESSVSRLASLWGRTGQNKKTGFAGGLISGLALGVVWSPCAGPILAAIATLGATGKVTGDVVLTTISYVIGVGIPLFIFAYGGRQIITRTRFISPYTGKIQRVFGVIMLLTAFAVYTNYDKVLEAKLLDMFPQFSVNLNKFEGNNAVISQLDALKNSQSSSNLSGFGLLNTNYPAPEFKGITNWLNSPPLSLKGLRGKVVLVDFWTYTCINCIRTLPHVTGWYEKYKDQGFVVVGVHTPEFEFEKDTQNVQNAINQYSIHYPVAQDNNYETWDNYNNQYWPAEYLIDIHGNVRRTHFGEGEYDQTELAIQTLLKEAGQKVNSNLEEMPDQTPQMRISPETYIGSRRMEFYYPDRTLKNGQQTFRLFNDIPQDSFSLGGVWNIGDEYSTAGKSAVLLYNFYANKVFLVLRPGNAGPGSQIKVYLDNKLVNSFNAGADVKKGVVTLDKDRLYNLVDLKNNPATHLLKLEFLNPGVEVFAFTFG